MDASCSVLLSSHSALALSRCSSLRGTILTCLAPGHRLVSGKLPVSAAQHATRPVHSAASAQPVGTKFRGGRLHGSLAEECPDLARQWDSEGNGGLTPSAVSAGSTYRASWRCERGCVHCGLPHVWVASVAQRFRGGTGCPFCQGNATCRCQSLAAKHPQLMKQWDWEGNQGLDPYSVSCYRRRKVKWTCTAHGQWDASPAHRWQNRTGCPECARQRKSENGFPGRGLLKDELPGVYAELHPTKNSGVDTETLTSGSAKKVWWLCQSDKNRPEGCEHEHAWETGVNGRCQMRHLGWHVSGCPFCSGRRVCPCNSFAALHPALLLCWSSDNASPSGEPLDPFELGASSRIKVWWRHGCADGRVHHWRAGVGDVVKSFKARGRVPCPDCTKTIRGREFAERYMALIKRK